MAIAIIITPRNNSNIFWPPVSLKFDEEVLLPSHISFQRFFDQREVQLQIHHFDDVKGKVVWQETNGFFDQCQRHV